MSRHHDALARLELHQIKRFQIDFRAWLQRMNGYLRALGGRGLPL